jgi:hypothetical protein
MLSEPLAALVYRPTNVALGTGVVTGGSRVSVAWRAD